MAAKAVAFTEALRPEFADYSRKIVANSRALAEAFISHGLRVLTGGTDNHLVLVDVASALGITGRQAEEAVRRCGITLNRNPIPFDPNGPWYTSGLRFGTPAVTTLGMGPADMGEIAAIVSLVLKNIVPTTTKTGAKDKAKYTLDDQVQRQAQTRAESLLASFPVYPELDLPLLKEAVGLG